MNRNIKAITDFIFISDELTKADIILILSASRPQLPEYDSQLIVSQKNDCMA